MMVIVFGVILRDQSLVIVVFVGGIFVHCRLFGSFWCVRRYCKGNEQRLSIPMVRIKGLKRSDG